MKVINNSNYLSLLNLAFDLAQSNNRFAGGK